MGSLESTAQKRPYLNDLERGLMDGDRRPSSSIKLGFESFDEKWRGNGSRESSEGPMPTGVPTGAATPPTWWRPAAPNWCSLSCDEHCDCKKKNENFSWNWLRPFLKLVLIRLEKLLPELSEYLSDTIHCSTCFYAEKITWNGVIFNLLLTK